jgi:AraC-like DNA-binding protein
MSLCFSCLYPHVAYIGPGEPCKTPEVIVLQAMRLAHEQRSGKQANLPGLVNARTRRKCLPLRRTRSGLPVYQRGRIAGIVRKSPRAKETLAHMQARRGKRGGLTVIQLAAESGWSPNTLHRMFRDEPGVSRIMHPETLRWRGYVSIRISRNVACRVLARHARKPYYRNELARMRARPVYDGWIFTRMQAVDRFCASGCNPWEVLGIW